MFLECYIDEDDTFREPFVVRIADGEDLPDFSEVWEEEPYSCDGDGRRGGPRLPVEEEAYETGGYEEPAELLDLYGHCAEVDPDDAYVTGDWQASEDNIPLLDARLILCPDHPHADAWAAAAEQGRVDLDLEEEGRLFFNGTFLVGDEVQPGTYYVEGDIEDCYWERQDSSGGIIDNFFTTGARRVEVTIQSGDYVFHSEGCAGPWRPVGS